MSEPRAAVDSLALAKRALQTKGRQPPVPVADPDEAEAMVGLLAASTAEKQAFMWNQVCPARFRAATWEWVEREHGQKVIDSLNGWDAGPDRNLVLLGPVGTGKTAAALLACKDGQLNRGIGVTFLPISELLDRLRPGGPVGELERLCAAPRLVIDDLGTERPTDWTAERLNIVVNRRWLECLPTVATSNLEPTDLCSALGERTYSRLVGDSALVLNLSGKDRRRTRP